LKETITLMAKTKETRWDHIPQSHNPSNHEDRKKVVRFQQLTAWVRSLQEKQQTYPAHLRTRIEKIVEKRTQEIEQLKEELQQIESETGQIYMMLSADHGGGTLKLFLQNLTTEKPNSVQSGYLLGEMDGPEKYSNLTKAFKKYQTVIDDLEHNPITYESADKKTITKKIVLFLGGDYSFLAENYQITGASGIDFCLWCRSEKDNRKTECLGPVKWGLGETAKTCQEIEDEVGKEAVFKIPLDRVAVLPFHILLGLTKDYLTILQTEVKKEIREKGNDHFSIIIITILFFEL
jgi:hypothetical protein